MTLQIRRIEPEKLNTDYSNLGDIILSELKKHLAGSNGNKIRAKLEEMTLAAGQRGHGVSADEIPTPYTQSGLECQTMALINGVNSVDGRKYLVGKDISSLVGKLRARAIQEGHSAYTMVWIEQYFPSEGIPLQPMPAPLNPIKLAESLFQDNTFLGISDAAKWHATSLVPLSNPTKVSFAVKLDSLGGRKSIIGVTQYVDMLLSMNPQNDNYRLYQVKH